MTNIKLGDNTASINIEDLRKEVGVLGIMTLIRTLNGFHPYITADLDVTENDIWFLTLQFRPYVHFVQEMETGKA